MRIGLSPSYNYKQMSKNDLILPATSPQIVSLQNNLFIFQALAQLQLIDYIGEQTALLIKVSFSFYGQTFISQGSMTLA